MSSKYGVYGKVNARPVKSKEFKNYSSALRYIDSLIDEYNLQIEEILSSDKENTFIANDYSRFILAKLA